MMLSSKDICCCQDWTIGTRNGQIEMSFENEDRAARTTSRVIGKRERRVPRTKGSCDGETQGWSLLVVEQL